MLSLTFQQSRILCGAWELTLELHSKRFTRPQARSRSQENKFTKFTFKSAARLERPRGLNETESLGDGHNGFMPTSFLLLERGKRAGATCFATCPKTTAKSAPRD